jgi:hypothetical protein
MIPKVYQYLILLLILLTASDSFAQKEIKADSSKLIKWFPRYDFDIASFNKPSVEFAPFARWWWPGNDVKKEELIREINLFADNDFGGVEIQPLNLFVPGPKEVRDKVNSWDTPDFYEKVKAVMEEARKRNIIVDMTDGSGWPPGGPHLSVDDGFLTVQFAALDVKGGTTVNAAIPSIDNKTVIPSHLVTVMAVKTLPKDSINKSKTVALDATSIKMLASNISNDSLHWKAPAGNWKIIAFWSKPSGEKGMTATPAQGYVVNHFDSVKVLKNYTYLFGERTGIQTYFGNPMRAIFNDSYEFQVDRFYVTDFLAYFKQKRGYDIAPWLPAEMKNKYNYASFMRPPDAVPDFSFSDEDWRLRYDYDLTFSELLGEQFFKASKDFAEPKGLLHRTQAYGMNMDMMKQAGLASIPETESMLGPEANLKIMTSGAHLYNRPIASAESVVFSNRAYTTTPQKIKIAVDKLFAAGVNQIIYHGVPYRYTPSDLGQEGWYPFSTPLFPGVNFSSNLGEGNIFWKYQKDVNEYINRTQYALRSGKPHADVLIYFPFMDVDGMPDNPEEILTKGYMKDIEGPMPVSKEKPNTPKEKWAENVYPLINQLEANGITWEWVNDESIQQAKLNGSKQINIRGNIYQALILADDSIIQLKTAQQINKLSKEGMNFIATGTLPNKQPSYLNWQVNDKQTAAFIKAALKAKNSKYISDIHQLSNWIKSLHRSVTFNGQYNFTRQVQRDMGNGSRIQFTWNKTDQWQTLSLSLDKKYNNSYWMNADDGSIVKNISSTISYQMPPYGSIILYASTKNNTAINATASAVDVELNNSIISIDKWNIKTDSIEIKDISLFDWKTNAQLKFSSAEGIYTSSFEWNNSNTSSYFYLDLGKVYFTAEVIINGKPAGKRIFAPYLLNITSLLQKGPNYIEVHVTTGQLNGFIGKAKNGDSKYKQFKGKEDQVMSAGLVGPVVIRQEGIFKSLKQ